MLKQKWMLGSVISLLCLTSPVQAVEGHHPFSDMLGSYAENAVAFLYQKGIINGVAEHQFGPNQTIKRKHFAALMAKSLGIQPMATADPAFEDIPQDAPEYGYIEALVHMNAIKGTASHLFGGDQPITRQDAAVLLRHVLSETGQASLGQQTSYTDQEQISPYALDAVGFVSWNSIMKGANGAFHPQQALTRAEAAVISQQIYERSISHAEINDWLFTPNRIAIKTGQSIQIRLTQPNGSLPYTPAWGLDHPEIGTISHDGYFTAKKAGKGIITLNIGYKTYRIPVEVAESPAGMGG